MRWIRPMVRSVGATNSAQYPATPSNAATPRVARPSPPACFIAVAETEVDAMLDAILLLQQIFAEKPGDRQKHDIECRQKCSPNRRQASGILKEAHRCFRARDQC